MVKKLREASGDTQTQLAEKTGLSLRTIQRLESSGNAPKGHTLQVLSNAFNVEPAVFQQKIQAETQTKEADEVAIKLINLAVLGFFIFPFGNIILPVILWRKRKTSKVVDQVGRKIINFQILWTIILCALLCVAPFLNLDSYFSFPLILLVLFFGLAVNLLIVGFTANAIPNGKLGFLDLPVRLL